MTIDWFVLLTPIVLLVVALPFLFVGCSTFGTAPGQPPAEPPPEPPPPGPGPGPPPPPPPTPPPQTTFRLEMDDNLSDGFNSPVIEIKVTWVLESTTPGVPQITLPQPPQPSPYVIISQQHPPPSPPMLQPGKDAGAVASILSADLGMRNTVRCICVVKLDNGNLPTVFGNNDAAVLQRDHTHEFRIKSRDPQNGLQVYFKGA